MASLSQRSSLPVTRLIWRMSYFGFLAFELILRILPLKFIFGIGVGIGHLVYFFSRRYRLIVQRNLRIVLFREGKSLDEIKALSRQSMVLASANLLSSLKTATMAPEKLEGVVDLQEDVLIEKLGDSGGVVMILIHMSNWELLAQASGIMSSGRPNGTHYRPLNNPYIDAIIKKRRARFGTRLFSKRASAHGLTSFVSEGGILGILSDQKPGNVGELCPYFGRLTTMTPLPALIARRAKSPMAALSLQTVGWAKWRADVVTLPEGSPNDARTTAQAIEEALKMSITDGFWLHQRFKLSNIAPFLLNGRKPSRPLPENLTPVRILIWQTENSLIEIPNQRTDLHCHYLRPANSELEDYDKLPAAEITYYEGNIPDWKSLIALDQDHLLPFEIVAATNRHESLRIASRKLGIRFYQLQSPSHS